MSRPAARGLTRRQFLAGSAGVGLSLWLTACSLDPNPKISGPVGIIRVGTDYLHPTFDIHDWDGPSGPRTFAPMFDALTFIDNTGALRPALALAWSQINPTTWQFRTRVSDAKFQNGEFFTPESVRLSFERATNPANNLALTPLVSTIDRVDVVDKATVNIVTKEPDLILPWRASLVYMLPPTYFGQLGAKQFFQQPIGTGQWQMADYQPDHSMKLKFFDDTWRAARGEPIPNLHALELYAFPKAEQRAEALRAGQVDIALDVTQQDAATFTQNGSKVVTSPTGRVLAFQFETSSGPFSNPSVRQAVNLAIDRDGLLRGVLAGQAAATTGQLTGSGSTGYDAGIASYAFDPAQARSLLQTAGGSSQAADIWCLPDAEPLAQTLAGALNSIGLAATAKILDFRSYVTFMHTAGRSGIFQASADYGLLQDADAAYFRYSAAVPDATRLANDTQLQALFKQSRSEADAGRRGQALVQLANRWHDQNLGIPLAYASMNAALAPGVKGLTSLPNGSWWFDRVLK